MLWLLYIRRLAAGFYDSCIVLHNLSVSVEEDRDVLGISKQIIIFGIFPFVPIQDVYKRQGYDACKKAGSEIGEGLCQDHRSSIG